MRPLFVVMMLFSVIVLGGCARLQTKRGAPLDYRTVSSSKFTSTARAERLYRKSLGFIEAEGYDFAEHYLQKALLADVSYGPAHNALGKVYFAQKKYYLAAWEFEHAAKTLPSRAEPVNNLGLVFEAVDQYDKAILHYQEAVSLAPDSSEYLANLLRARTRNGESVSTMRTELESLLLIEDRIDWCDWARKLLALDRNSYEEFCPPDSGETLIVPSTEIEIADPSDKYWQIDDPDDTTIPINSDDSEWVFPDLGTSEVAPLSSEISNRAVLE